LAGSADERRDDETEESGSGGKRQLTLRSRAVLGSHQNEFHSEYVAEVLLYARNELIEVLAASVGENYGSREKQGQFMDATRRVSARTYQPR
jgi:hypothetical protein